eukprot:542690-Alexandrium_andersonii.AAC.1
MQLSQGRPAAQSEICPVSDGNGSLLCVAWPRVLGVQCVLFDLVPEQVCERRRARHACLFQCLACPS